MTSFTALIDGRTGAYGVYFPDLPGCTAMGATLEEAVVNAMIAADTMVGADDHKVIGLPHDQLQAIFKKYNRLQ